MEYVISKTASAWDSFKSTLLSIMDHIKPRNILEYGPGISTKIMDSYGFVESIDSVEHDEAWYEKYRNNFTPRVFMILEQDLEKYPTVISHIGRYYDLIFIDGRERERCLDYAPKILKPNGIILLHDSERPAYKSYIDKYSYVFFTDNGHTVVLTNDKITSEILNKILYEDSLSRA